MPCPIYGCKYTPWGTFYKEYQAGGGYSLFNNPRFLRVGTRTERRLWSRDSAERFSEAVTPVGVFVVVFLVTTKVVLLICNLVSLRVVCFLLATQKSVAHKYLLHIKKDD